MNCNEARQHLMLYLDSEGDPELHFRISDHLGMCPDCAEWFAKQQRFEQAVNERLAVSEPTPQMWDRVLIKAGVVSPVASRRPWLVFGSMLSAAAVIVAVLVLTRGQPLHSELEPIAAEWHDSWARGDLKPDLVSDSDELVDGYLKEQVQFRVHCPPRKDVKFAVAGAGVRTVKDQSAAYIVGNVDKAAITILVFARDSLNAFPKDRSHLEGGGRHRCREKNYEMVSGVTADNVVFGVGAAAPEVLEQVLNAYGSYHDTEGA
jgi:hypothetical protein